MAAIFKCLPSYIKETNHTEFIFTMDKTSLYVVIPNYGGLQVLKYFFQSLGTVKEPSTETDALLR